MRPGRRGDQVPEEMSKPQPMSWRTYRGGRFARLAQLLMTRYVDRFHPATMVADCLSTPDILEAFRLINGAPGIAEAVIRWFGPIRATRDGFVKNADYGGPTPVEIVRPLRSATPGEQRGATDAATRRFAANTWAQYARSPGTPGSSPSTALTAAASILRRRRCRGACARATPQAFGRRALY